MEGNFGQTYDSLNQSLGGLRGEFSATIDLKVGGAGPAGVARRGRRARGVGLEEGAERAPERGGWV